MPGSANRDPDQDLHPKHWDRVLANCSLWGRVSVLAGPDPSVRMPREAILKELLGGLLLIQDNERYSSAIIEILNRSLTVSSSL